jgi:hypothetical protein
VNRFYIMIAGILAGWLVTTLLDARNDSSVARWVVTLTAWARTGLIVLPAVCVGWWTTHLISSTMAGSEPPESAGEGS